MIELAIVLSLLTGVGIAAATRGSGVATIWGLKQMRALYIKRVLNRKLKKTLKRCAFNDFQKVIYDIKNFDIQYDKSYLNDVKTKYNLTEDELISRSSFNDRFNKNKGKSTLDDVLDCIDEKYKTFKI